MEYFLEQWLYLVLGLQKWLLLTLAVKHGLFQAQPLMISRLIFFIINDIFCHGRWWKGRQWSFTEHLSCALYFMLIFYSPNLKSISLLLFCKLGDWGLKPVSGLHKSHQLVKTWTHNQWTPNICSFNYTVLPFPFISPAEGRELVWTFITN